MLGTSEQLELETRVGSLFFVGIDGPEMDVASRDLLTAVSPSGVCLFARNIKTAAQTRELTEDIRSVCGPDVLISIDQEGGRVDRLRRILEPMPPVSQLRTPQDGARLAGLTARALRMLGINMNFAPVVDVGGGGRDSSSNGLATRLYGQGPDAVAEFASAYIGALSESGVKSCLKHFPGLGKCEVDSHEELPVVGAGLDEFEAIDLAPYRTLNLDAENTAVMVGHAVYPNHPAQGFLSSGGLAPSSISGEFISGLLREDIGFDGLIVTDDLEMGAIQRTVGISEACVMGLQAGNDLLLICNEARNILAGYDAVLGAAREGTVSEARIEGSLGRIRRMRRSLAEAFPFQIDEWSELSEDIRRFKAELVE